MPRQVQASVCVEQEDVRERLQIQAGNMPPGHHGEDRLPRRMLRQLEGHGQTPHPLQFATPEEQRRLVALFTSSRSFVLVQVGVEIEEFLLGYFFLAFM
jgi:hypothetical protein